MFHITRLGCRPRLGINVSHPTEWSRYGILVVIRIPVKLVFPNYYYFSDLHTWVRRRMHGWRVVIAEFFIVFARPDFGCIKRTVPLGGVTCSKFSRADAMRRGIPWTQQQED